MNFSDLPNNSWEKVMVHLVGWIGGDDASLVNWSNEIPDPVRTANAILGMIQHYDSYYCDMPEGSLACAIGAIYLASLGITGWGWFLFVAIMTTSYFSSSNKEND